MSRRSCGLLAASVILSVTARQANHFGLSEIASSPGIKNIPLPSSAKSPLSLCPSTPARGAYRDRHGRGVGCGGRSGVGRDRGRRAGYPVSDPTSRRRPAFQGSRQNLKSASRRSEWRRGRCVRRSRVVLASVADVKPAETRRPDRAQDKSQSAGDGDKRNSSPGRARISRKAIAQGMPDCLR